MVIYVTYGFQPMVIHICLCRVFLFTTSVIFSIRCVKSPTAKLGLPVMYFILHV